MVHRIPEAHQLDRHLGGSATRQDSPVDLGESEGGFLRRNGQIARKQRPVATAETPAIDHRDGGLLIPAQLPPPAVGLRLSLAGALQTQGLGLAKILLQIHSGGPRRAGPGQHEHADVVTELELLEGLQHRAVERGTHRIALLRAIEAEPRNAVLDSVRDNIFGLGHGDSSWHPAAQSCLGLCRAAQLTVVSGHLRRYQAT